MNLTCNISNQIYTENKSTNIYQNCNNLNYPIGLIHLLEKEESNMSPNILSINNPNTSSPTNFPRRTYEIIQMNEISKNILGISTNIPTSFEILKDKFKLYKNSKYSNMSLYDDLLNNNSKNIHISNYINSNNNKIIYSKLKKINKEVFIIIDDYDEDRVGIQSKLITSVKKKYLITINHEIKNYYHGLLNYLEDFQMENTNYDCGGLMLMADLIKKILKLFLIYNKVELKNMNLLNFKDNDKEKNVYNLSNNFSFFSIDIYKYFENYETKFTKAFKHKFIELEGIKHLKGYCINSDIEYFKNLIFILFLYLFEKCNNNTLIILIVDFNSENNDLMVNIIYKSTYQRNDTNTNLTNITNAANKINNNSSLNSLKNKKEETMANNIIKNRLGTSRMMSSNDKLNEAEIKKSIITSDILEYLLINISKMLNFDVFIQSKEMHKSNNTLPGNDRNDINEYSKLINMTLHNVFIGTFANNLSLLPTSLKEVYVNNINNNNNSVNGSNILNINVLNESYNQLEQTKSIVSNASSNNNYDKSILSNKNMNSNMNANTSNMNIISNRDSNNMIVSNSNKNVNKKRHSLFVYSIDRAKENLFQKSMEFSHNGNNDLYQFQLQNNLLRVNTNCNSNLNGDNRVNLESITNTDNINLMKNNLINFNKNINPLNFQSANLFNNISKMDLKDNPNDPSISLLNNIHKSPKTKVKSSNWIDVADPINEDKEISGNMISNSNVVNSNVVTHEEGKSSEDVNNFSRGKTYQTFEKCKESKLTNEINPTSNNTVNLITSKSNFLKPEILMEVDNSSSKISNSKSNNNESNSNSNSYSDSNSDLNSNLKNDKTLSINTNNNIGNGLSKINKVVNIDTSNTLNTLSNFNFTCNKNVLPNSENTNSSNLNNKTNNSYNYSNDHNRSNTISNNCLNFNSSKATSKFICQASNNQNNNSYYNNPSNKHINTDFECSKKPRRNRPPVMPNELKFNKSPNTNFICTTQNTSHNYNPSNYNSAVNNNIQSVNSSVKMISSSCSLSSTKIDPDGYSIRDKVSSICSFNMINLKSINLKKSNSVSKINKNKCKNFYKDLLIKKLNNKKNSKKQSIKGLNCNCCDIAIVDDESYILDSLEKGIKMQGYKCDRFLDGKYLYDKILEKLKSKCSCGQNYYKLIISDVCMNDWGGLQTSKEIGKLVDNGVLSDNFSLIFISGHNGKYLDFPKYKFIKGFFSKPVGKNTIIKIINEYYIGYDDEE